MPYAHPVFRELEAERKRQGLTATELAARMGYDRSYVTQYERGHREVSARFRARAAEVLGRPEHDLFPTTRHGAP